MENKNQEKINNHTKEIMDRLIDFIGKSLYSVEDKNKARDELRNKYEDIIANHLIKILTSELLDENIEKLTETIEKSLDKKYLPKVKKEKPILSDEELEKKKKLLAEKREQRKLNPVLKSVHKRTKAQDNLFSIPILVKI